MRRTLRSLQYEFMFLDGAIDGAFQTPSRLPDVGRSKQGRHDGRTRNPCSFKGRYGLFVQASDGHDGYIDRATYIRKRSKANVSGLGLRSRFEQRPHAEVVGAGIRRRKGLIDRLHGHADDFFGTENPAGLFAGGIALSHMHAVGLRHTRRLEIIVDDKGNVARNHATQTTALLDEIARRGVFIP